MIKKIVLISFLISATLFLTTSLPEATMIGMSTEELTLESNLAIKGTVEKVESFWTRDRKLIVSWSTIKIEEVIRGRYKKKKIVIESIGGEVDGKIFQLSDEPYLKKDEKVVLFLEPVNSRKDGSPVYAIYGLAQGKYLIKKNGVAVKNGFFAIQREELIENNINVNKLIEKIKSIK